MTLKRLYKRLLPLGVRNRIAGLPWMERFRNRQLIREGWRLAERARANRKPDGKIRVTFIVQRPALWPNHASIYEAMKADPAFTASVIAIPKRPPAAKDLDLAEYRRLMEFLDGKGIPYSEGYDMAGRVWINPLGFGLPDVVFLPQPYAFTQSYLYGGAFWACLAQIAYVTYGAILSATMTNVLCKDPFFRLCRWIFVENEYIRDMYEFHDSRLASRVWVVGQPKTDAYLAPARSVGLWKLSGATRRIIWAPHFTVSQERTPHAFSTFFEYFDYFLGCAEAHPDIEFVLRPHPELFEHMVAAGLKTRSAAEEFRKRFNALANGQVYEGGDVFEMFKNSDALILDSLGFLLEFLPTGKPVCFLESVKRQPLNPVGEDLLASYYKARNPAEIGQFIEDVVIAGHDPLRTARQAVGRKYVLAPPGGVGNAIKDLIRQEWKAGRPRVEWGGCERPESTRAPS